MAEFQGHMLPRNMAVTSSGGSSPVSGSGTSGQVTYWNGASSITGSSNLLFDNTNGFTNKLGAAFGSDATLASNKYFDFEQTTISFSGGTQYTMMPIVWHISPSADFVPDIVTSIIEARSSTSHTVNNITALEVTSFYNGTGDITEVLRTSLIGTEYRGSPSSGNPQPQLVGCEFFSIISGGNAHVTQNIAVDIGAGSTQVGTIIDDNRAVWIYQLAGGTITNNYGIYMDDVNAGVKNWAIKTGLGLVEFGDKVGIGTATPSAALSFGTTDAEKTILLYDDPSGGGAFYGLGMDAGLLTIFHQFGSGSGIGFGTMNGNTFAPQMLMDTNGNLGIGTDTPAAILDLTSTTKGFLPPRMTTTQRNAITPVEGLLIYDTTIHGLFNYNGTTWVQL